MLSVGSLTAALSGIMWFAVAPASRSRSSATPGAALGMWIYGDGDLDQAGEEHPNGAPLLLFAQGRSHAEPASDRGDLKRHARRATRSAGRLAARAW
jgi:hypothetical protein